MNGSREVLPVMYGVDRSRERLACFLTLVSYWLVEHVLFIFLLTVYIVSLNRAQFGVYKNFPGFLLRCSPNDTKTLIPGLLTPGVQIQMADTWEYTG